MKRKLATTIIMTIITMGLMACGSNNSALVDEDASVQED